MNDSPEQDLRVTPALDHAAGVRGVAVAMKHAMAEMGPVRTTRTLSRVNQVDGFDCMSCAWPDPEPGHRHSAEFCENGAKAVAEEATKARVGRDFFARHSIEELRAHEEFWLGKQGRLTEPMVKWPGASHYAPVGWDEALGIVAQHLTSLPTPDGAAFYTSGRASNEAAFMYQLFAKALGTNNLPDCSNMCHESSGVAMIDSIGVGKGSVSLLDLYAADLIVVVGQNPGTNHPRMLSALETAKRRGAKILAINPLREAGTNNFRNPQKVSGVVGKGTDLADLHLPVRLNGDLALFQAIGHLLLSWGAGDRGFVDSHTAGFNSWAAHLRDLDCTLVEEATGLHQHQIVEAARMVEGADAAVWCWGMGVTQHHNSVATIREIVNVALLRGDIGRPGAGLCPVRGHSNVQGDRTMGIWEKPPQDFLDRLEDEFGFRPPQDHGFDVVETIEAMLRGEVSVFVALGGNFVQAAPDTGLTTQALEQTELTVQISTKLNRSHLIGGRTALILPTLGRTEIDVQASGAQEVTVEDSMSVVHASRGTLPPASSTLRSEVAIVCDLASATLGDRFNVDWQGCRDDYRTIRAHISRVVPGFEDFETRVARPAGFVLPHPPRDSRTFPTASGRAEFAVSELEVLEVPSGHLVLQTLRSHDQFNTTIYGLDDRYRGIRGGRRVLFMNHKDVAAHDLQAGDLVDIHARWSDERSRSVTDFRIVEYATPPGTAAAYYPETNPLVPLGSVAVGSNTPTSKSIVVRLTRSENRTNASVED